MDSCCGHANNLRFDGMDKRYIRTLWIVIIINALMFVVEMAGGTAADSMGLQADALDFFADTVTYGITLWAIGKPLSVRANAAFMKGISLVVIAAYVLLASLYRVFVLETPVALTMGIIGALAFAANLASVLLLYRYRKGDSNIQSVWLCSRNDMIGNAVIILAAAGVYATASPWPDLAIAFLLAGLFMNSAIKILRQSIQERKEARHHHAAP
ncbi:MAG: cation transporter [Alphaproteobacteria bacterium]|nr:cation transporter [Alphaproteobacteria bacterium]